MPDATQFKVEVLNPQIHRREKFSCESPELTEFLRMRARKKTKARASACFVLVPSTNRGRIGGFYTLSATSIALEKLSGEPVKKLPTIRSCPPRDLGGWRVS